MKVRVTLMTENDKHPGVNSEQVKQAWDMLAKMLNTLSSDENMKVESVEIVER